MSGLVVPSRFRGPDRSGNGGWTAGTLAERVEGAGDRPVVEVGLRQPPPLDVSMRVDTVEEDDGPVTVMSLGGSVVARARAVADGLTSLDEVDVPVARAARERYAGMRAHPFAGCFACGPDRAEGDGLRIFPGRVEGAAESGDGARAAGVASTWVPHASLAESGDVVDPGVERVGLGTAWAALDCVGGWSADIVGRPMVLVRMTARVDALPVVGEEHVVVGRWLGREGRKTTTAATLYDADGRVVGTAEHLWVDIDPALFS